MSVPTSTQPARPLTADEQRTFAGVRLRALEHQPYLATALLRMVPVAAPGLATFAVDAAWRLYVDPQTMRDWGPALSAAVLVHEVNHLIRDHHGRAVAHGARQPTIWNAAADAAINADLVDAGVPLPEGTIIPSTYGLPEGESCEVYYDRLAVDPPDPLTRSAASGRWDGGCGGGSGGMRAPCEMEVSGAPGISAAEAELIRRRVAEEVRTAARSRGTVPAGLARWADMLLEPAKVPWQQVLSSAVRRAVAHQAGAYDFTYQRRSRRDVPRVLLPGMHRPKVRVASIVDTSGSMSADDLTAALTEVGGICRQAGVRDRDHLLLAVDADASEPQHVRDPSRIELAGGGGTDMRVGIDAALRLRPAPNVIVVFTDGFTPWPQAAPAAARLIVALIGDQAGVTHARSEWPPPPGAVVVEVVR